MFAGLVWLCLSPLVTVLGATGHRHDLTVQYLSIVMPSQPLLMVGMIGGAILRNHGDARRAMASYGEAAVAGMAITGRLTPVAFGVIFALSGAIGPIVGQNYGAGRMDRVKRVFYDGLTFTGLVIVGVSLLLFVLRGPVVNLFSATDVTRQLVFLFCGPLSLAFFFNGRHVSNAVCNNLGRPFWSTIINWRRHTVGTVPFALGLVRFMAHPAC